MRFPPYTFWYGLFLVALIAAIALIVSFYRFSIIQIPRLTLNPFDKKPISHTQNWRKFTTADKRVSFYYPPDWYLFEGTYVSQYPYTPGRSTSDIYNVISVQEIKNQLQSGYLNDDWFNIIYTAEPDQVITNKFRPNSLIQINKVESGKTNQGKKYVIFKELASPRILKTYLISSPVLYEIDLGSYDQAGFQTFKQILSTVTLN